MGYGAIRHKPETRSRIEALNIPSHGLFAAATRLANAAMWLAAHQTYARNIYLDGRALVQEDFKPDPQGHLGGSLNMIPAYVGYLLANMLTHTTRGWVMEQGHAVAAIDSTNLLVGNLSEAHAARYDLSQEGLSRFARDFYSYALNAKGEPDSPLGSHVNPHTAGGVMEGGYLGFAGLEYVHMPLPGESIVAFLSDGAWEEQKGSDWAPRWWRAEDSGLVVPIMIANGRRIDQRTTMAQAGGARWFAKYLKLHGFDAVIIDGRDPLAFAWAIIACEQQLRKNAGANERGQVRLPYVIAVAPKGAGFYGEGTNTAHNLPLGENPAKSKKAAANFNKYARKLFVPEAELKEAIALFQNHAGRPREKDHPLAHRRVSLKSVPQVLFLDTSQRNNPLAAPRRSPMDSIDRMFRQTALLNPHLRPRIGNPDEMLSNRMDDTLRMTDFRVSEAEEGMNESPMGSVITALNEEAVAAAAFGNKGGINMIVTYEAFGEKMHGIARQEVIFARHQKEAGKPAGWLSVPLVLTSNTWENGKNELSHQDPSMAECMFGESADISRVFFPPDCNSAAVLMRELYQTHGQIWTLVMSKQPAPLLFDEQDCTSLWRDGALRLSWAGHQPETATLTLIALGTHQLLEVFKASGRLTARGIAHAIVYLQEPGKLRAPRNDGEAAHVISEEALQKIIPAQTKQLLFVMHTRPEVMAGALTRLWKSKQFEALGFINNGGTLDVEGMLFVNRCSWGHLVEQSAALLNLDAQKVLSTEEIEALSGKRSPDGILRGSNAWQA